MRQCGDCQLCCKLMPVADPLLQKRAGERCRHQVARKGCRIYQHQAMPSSCRAWSCAWLSAKGAENLRRPDRAHYVVDILADYVKVPGDNGESSKLPVVQVWCDPDYPHAHRDPALRAFLEPFGERGVAVLVRYNQSEAIALFPPAMSPDGQWHEVDSKSTAEPQHTAAEVAAVMKEHGVETL